MATRTGTFASQERFGSRTSRGQGSWLVSSQDRRQPSWVPERLTRVLKDDQRCDADSPGNTDDGDRVQE